MDQKRKYIEAMNRYERTRFVNNYVVPTRDMSQQDIQEHLEVYFANTSYNDMVKQIEAVDAAISLTDKDLLFANQDEELKQ